MATTTRSRRSAETAPAAPTQAASEAAPRKTAAKKAAAPRKKLPAAVAAAAPTPAPAAPAPAPAPAARKAAAKRAAPKEAPAPAATAPAAPRAAAKKAAPAAKPAAAEPVAVAPAVAPPPKAVKTAPAKRSSAQVAVVADVPATSATQAPAKAPAKSAARSAANAPAKAPAKPAKKAPAKKAVKPADQEAEAAPPAPAAATKAAKKPAAKAPAPAAAPSPAESPLPAPAPSRAKPPAGKTAGKAQAPRAAPQPADKVPAEATAPAPTKTPGPRAGAPKRSPATEAPAPVDAATHAADAPVQAVADDPETPSLKAEAQPVDLASAAPAPAPEAPSRSARGTAPRHPPRNESRKDNRREPRDSRRDERSDERSNERRSDTRAAAPSPRPAPPAAPVAPPSPFRWQQPEADEVFEPIVLKDSRDGSQYTLQLRSLTAGDNRCTCVALRTSLDGQCEHLRFVLGALAEEPEAAAVLAHGWHPLHSEVYLRLGARRSLRWSPGSICPPELEAAAQALQDEDGSLHLDHPAALPSLLRLADEQGQALRVSDEAWQQLAHRRDAGNRLRRLEQAYPEGPESPALLGLLKLPLRPYQAEGALFAAVAGRAVLADEDGLGKTVQAVAALELALRHFGVERALIVGTASQEAHWQQALADLAGRPLQGLAGEAALRWASFEQLAADPAALDALAPELVIVDEAVEDGAAPFDTALLARVQAPAALLVTREPLEARPEALLPRVEWLDAYRLGPLARFLDHHLPDGPEGTPTALDELDVTLRHLMLRRQRNDVADQLPESVELTWPAPLGADQRRLHDAAAADARAVLARWQRSHFVSDSGQHALAGALRRMLEACTDTGADAPAKLDALMALLPELLDRPDTRVVVCAARPQTALHAGRRLAAAGIDHAVFGASEAMRKQLEGNTQLRVVLCADSSAERLPPQPLKTVLVHLDPPCQPSIQQRRLQRVQGGAPARNLPAVLLLAPDTLEDALWALPADDRAQVAALLAGQGSQAFLEGEALERFMATAQTLLQGGPARA